jgi:hypothetical protein
MGDREAPADLPRLPFIDLAEWLAKHPVSMYWESTSAGEIVEKGVVAVVVHGVTHVFEALEPVAWLHLGWDFLELVAEANERPEKAKEAQFEAWNEYMVERFWNNEAAYPSATLRETAFDELVGDNASHGIVPQLTPDAELHKQEMIRAADERWLQNMHAMVDAKEKLEFWEPRAEERHRDLLERVAKEMREADANAAKDPDRAERAHRWAEWAKDAIARHDASDEDVYVAQARATMESYKADLQKVAEFETNPSNWELTPDQKAMLHDLACETPKATCDMPAGQTVPTEAGQVSGPVSDDADRIYDVVGGRPDLGR